MPEIQIESMEMLVNYHWPGNVRELEHAVERLTILVEGNEILPSHVSSALFKTEVNITSSVPKNIDELNTLKKQIRDSSIHEIEKMFIIEALRRNDWNISQASREVNMQRSNFQALMRKYEIKKHTSDA